MKLNLELAKKILDAMFIDWSFDFNIEIIDDEEFVFSIENNNKQYLYLKMENPNSNRIEVWINTRSENNRLLGYYYVKNQSKESFAYKEGQFERKYDFFEIMFSEHLSF